MSDKIKYYNYPLYVMLASKKLASNVKRFQMFMGMPLQEFEFFTRKGGRDALGGEKEAAPSLRYPWRCRESET